ncbi:MAG: integral rane protein, partial [Ilumatobacteraceae bacterium]|nr:integral rane protein [Ilumatobacteraceae bacterium]
GGRDRTFPVAAGFAALACAWATPWSVATPELTFATLAIGIVAAAAIAVVARRGGAVEVAGAAAAWLVVATPLLAGLLAWHAGLPASMAWALGAVVVAVVSLVGVVLLDPTGAAPTVSCRMREVVEAVALGVYLVALVVTVGRADPDAVSVVLGAGVIGFGLHAVRPGRSALGVLSATELLALVWLRLDQADVVTVEAYTLPLALLLLGTGLIGARLHDEGEGPASWVSLGPAAVVGLAPTVWLAFTEPGSIRPLAGLVAGAVVLVAGVAWSKRALVDAGTVTVVLLGLRQIAPVVGEVPNWVTIGATGVLLIVVGATFEQRRRDLKAVLQRYSALT